MPTGMLRAPIGNPASKGIFPSELPIFSSQTGTQTVKTQFGTPAQKMQKEVRTDEWRTSFLLTILNRYDTVFDCQRLRGDMMRSRRQPNSNFIINAKNEKIDIDSDVI